MNSILMLPLSCFCEYKQKFASLYSCCLYIFVLYMSLFSVIPKIFIIKLMTINMNHITDFFPLLKSAFTTSSDIIPLLPPVNNAFYVN